MDDQNPPPPDPEIEALLHFTPVERRNKRSDGWPPERQTGFIAALARLGNVDRAAHEVGRTASGAWTVRGSANAGQFAESWDAALALYHRRNPRQPRVGRPSRGALRADPGRAWPRHAGEAEEQDARGPDAEDEHRLKLETFDRILQKYENKLRQEREARLEGRIAAADFYVRQLTFIEITLELGGQVDKLLHSLKRREWKLFDIAATPMSVLLDNIRRDYWQEQDEPDRPPLSPLGEHDGAIAFGEPTYYTPERDGTPREWDKATKEAAALAAQAQRAWEEKARKDAKEWRERVGGRPTE